MSSSFFLKRKKLWKRKVEITFGLYFNFSRMCNWNRECMEIRLYGRPRWWRIFVLLYLLFLVMLGILSCQWSLLWDVQARKVRLRHTKLLKKRDKMAYSRIYCFNRQLFTNDVLHNGCRLDALLFLSYKHRKIRWT